MPINPKPQGLTPFGSAFSSADVMIYGARLGQILEKLIAQRLDWVAIVDERYAVLSERAWVGRIDFQPYGKQTPPSAPPSDTTEDRGPIRTSLSNRNQGDPAPFPLPDNPAPSGSGPVQR